MRVRVRLQEKEKGYAELVKRLFEDTNPYLTVGVHEAEGAQAEGDVTIADIATWNEFGTSTIPPRPFIRGWFDENQGRVQEAAKRLMVQVLQGKITAEVALERLGLWIVGQVKARIAQGWEPANAPRTIAQKGSSKPLIDTGRLRASISHKVETGGKK